MAGLLLLLLIPFLATGDGGFGVWLFLTALVVLVSALYALVFRRPSWVRLTSPTARKRALGLAGAMAIVGLVVTGMTAPAVEKPVEAAAEKSPSPSPTKTTASPTPTPTQIASKACKTAGAIQTLKQAASPSPTPSDSSSAKASPSSSPSTTAASPSATPTSQTVVYVCTEDDNGKLIWMDEDKSKKLIADRKASEDKKADEEKKAADDKKAAEDKKAADAAAAEEAERKRAADEAAAAAAATEAQRLADEQAAAAEAQRVADEQARQQYVPPAPVPVPASVYYDNCSAVKAAGAAPLYRGQPGYETPRLDKDGDGVACAGD